MSSCSQECTSSASRWNDWKDVCTGLQLPQDHNVVEISDKYEKPVNEIRENVVVMTGTLKMDMRFLSLVGLQPCLRGTL